MSRFNNYICAIILLLSFSALSQTTFEEDEETIQNTIDARINQAQKDIEKNAYFEAQEKYDQALELAIKIDNQKSIGIIYSKIGKLQYIIEEPDEAIKSLIKANEVQRFAKDDVNLAETYKTLGNVYTSKKQYQQALDYYKSAKTLFEQEGLDNFVAEVLLNEGITYINLKKYNEAKTHLLKSISVAKRFDLDKILSSAKINLGTALINLGETEDALAQANEGLKMAKTNHFNNVLNDGYLILSELNQEIGNYKLANQYLKKHIKLNDSLLSIKRSSLSQEKRMQLLIDNQTEYQKKQLADLEEQKAANNLNKLTTI
ncbi:MAG: tetratricopeptide repeat protein, partial [Xanthomarina gelatinilytica]|nr:tetratricopeptide repeat protein [Xanthomarina gelatinilytica]